MSNRSVSQDYSLASQTTINEDQTHRPNKELALWAGSDSVAPAQQAMADGPSNGLHSQVETSVEENKGVVLWNEKSTVDEGHRPIRRSQDANSSPTFARLGEVISQDLILWDGNEPTTLSLSTTQRTLDPTRDEPLELFHGERLEDERESLPGVPFLTVNQQSEVQAEVREENSLHLEDKTLASSCEEARVISEVVVKKDERMIVDSPQISPVETLSSAVSGSPSSQAIESKLVSGPASNVSDVQGRKVRAIQLSSFWLLASSLLFVGFIIFSNIWFAPPAQSTPRESQAVNFSQISNPAVSNSSTNTSPVIEPSTVAPLPSSASDNDALSDTQETTKIKDGVSGETAEESAPVAASTAFAESTPQASSAPAEHQPVAPSSTIMTSQAGGFTTQVSSSQNVEDSNRRADDLKAAGFPAHVVKVEVPKRGIWYRVQVGSFVTRKEAESFATLLKSKGAASGVIVTEAQ